jgi:molybdopterin molybdotransferase
MPAPKRFRAKKALMLSVDEAQSVVLQHAPPLPPATVPATHAALGLVLAEDVASDLDMPPYDKALMDGYALRSADPAGGRCALRVVEEVGAGQTPRVPVGPGQATRIMTGAPLPEGADAVVMVERTCPLGEDRVQVEDRVVPGQNVLPRGKEMRRGETVLAAGAVLRPQEFGLLATVGHSHVRVHPRPVVAVLATGDELVEAPQAPGLGQIRNGNGPMLQAQAARAGGAPRYLGIARDDRDALRALVAEGLQSPVLILSGGVSAGQRDLVPEVLQDLGVTAHFHKVAMKPGKPVFFGSRKRTLVFGLPGNPVSSLVCFELFVRPALHRLGGHRDPLARTVRAALATDFVYETDRPTYHPASLEEGGCGWQVRPVPWFGSPDLRGLTRANALLVLPAGQTRGAAGESFPVMRLDD